MLRYARNQQQQQPGAEVPDALAVKYPGLSERGGWFWVFPAPKLSIDPRSHIERRHHLYDERLQRAIKLACVAALIHKQVSVYTLRHPFAAGGYSHSHGAKVAGPLRRFHHHYSHTCTQGGVRRYG